MKLYPTTLNVCLTTTLFVIAASLFLGRFMLDTQPKDVLGITAAYAAVLVVFVGTSTTESGLSNAKIAIVMGTLVGVLGLVMGISAAQLAWRRFWYKIFNSHPLKINHLAVSSLTTPGPDSGQPSESKPDIPTAASTVTS